jgi:Domain of unknown function (DUF4412)
MKRLCLALIVLAIGAAPALADVTVTMNVSINVGPIAMSGQTTTLLKGTKVRSDAKIGSQDLSMVFDPAARRMLLLNHGTKEITVFDPLQSMAALSATFGDVQASVKPLGQTKEILGRACQGFTIEMTIPMTMNGETVTIKASGQVWMAKDGPGVAEYKSVQKVLADAGLSMSPFGQGPSAKAMAEVAKALADAGMTMEQEINMTVEGTGQVAQVTGQMGGMTMKMTVTAISTDPIADEKFRIPEGYTKK